MSEKARTGVSKGSPSPRSPRAIALFDYHGARRGVWAVLRGGGHTVIATEHPGTLLAMLKAGVLTGQALKDAEEASRR